jgi:hypothetical protein
MVDLLMEALEMLELQTQVGVLVVVLAQTAQVLRAALVSLS